MPLSTKETFIYPGPTEGVTLLGSDLTLTNYNEVTTTAVPADKQVAVLSVVANYKAGSIAGVSPIFIADEDENIILMLSAGGQSHNEYGFIYPPLLPAGKKLKVKVVSPDSNEANLVI